MENRELRQYLYMQSICQKLILSTKLKGSRPWSLGYDKGLALKSSL